MLEKRCADLEHDLQKIQYEYQNLQQAYSETYTTYNNLWGSYNQLWYKMKDMQQSTGIKSEVSFNGPAPAAAAMVQTSQDDNDKPRVWLVNPEYADLEVAAPEPAQAPQQSHDSKHVSDVDTVAALYDQLAEEMPQEKLGNMLDEMMEVVTAVDMINEHQVRQEVGPSCLACEGQHDGIY